MQPTTELIDSLFKERVLRARQMTPEEKFSAGPDLFEKACQVMRDGIRDEYPDADDQRLEAILAERFAVYDRLKGMR